MWRWLLVWKESHCFAICPDLCWGTSTRQRVCVSVDEHVAHWVCGLCTADWILHNVIQCFWIYWWVCLFVFCRPTTYEDILFSLAIQLNQQHTMCLTLPLSYPIRLFHIWPDLFWLQSFWFYLVTLLHIFIYWMLMLLFGVSSFSCYEPRYKHMIMLYLEGDNWKRSEWTSE